MIVLAELVLSPIALDTILIMSILLGIIGPLYLAYDLFGRENGPLRWFTLVITCGLVSASVLGIVGSILNQLVKGSFDLNFTLQAPLTVVATNKGPNEGRHRLDQNRTDSHQPDPNQ